MTATEADLREQIYAALETVIDPEIGIDVVSLGLIYDVTIADDTVDVTFTLTTKGCPMEHAMRGGIEHALGDIAGIARVRAHLVWKPRWHTGLVREGAL